MRTISLLAGVALIASADNLATCAPMREPSATARGIGCRSIDSADVDLRAFVVKFTSGIDSASAQTRAGADLPLVTDAGQISLVTDDAICNAAARAHARAARQKSPSPVTVLRVGPTRYVVYNGFKAGEWYMHFVFDTAWVQRGAFGG